MVYLTVKQSPAYHQITLDDLLSDKQFDPLVSMNHTNTHTYTFDEVPEKFRRFSSSYYITRLLQFNNACSRLRNADKHTLYTNFYIAKQKGGYYALQKAIFDTQHRFVECNSAEVYRNLMLILNPLIQQHPASQHESIFEGCKIKLMAYLKKNGFDTSLIDFNKVLSSAFRKIDAPVAELKEALSNLKNLFEHDFGLLYHTSAFAYVHGRCTIDAVKRHQLNESKWFAKLDFSNFFGSTTPEFVMDMLSKIYPFSEVVKSEQGDEALRTAMSLAFLDGGLPQGTPFSPTITNIMMIPIDFALTNAFREFGEGERKQRFVYTRYADDLIISSRQNFDVHKIESFIVETLASFNAPFSINSKKTRYGSSAGRNWNLGVMLNQNNEITVGYQKKREFTAMVHNYAMDNINGNPWSKSDVQVMDGLRSYYKSVEGDRIEKIIDKISSKLRIDIRAMIKADLKR